MNYKNLFTSFQQQKIFIIGDVMLDHYIYGKVERISPEAPVPVVAVQSFDDRAGGAANVAMNIKAMAAQPFILSVMGADENGKKLAAILKKNKIATDGIIFSKERITTLKARVIGNNHQLLRYDLEVVRDLTAKEEDELFSLFKKLAAKEKPNAVILEDYNKGVLTATLIKKIIDWCNANSIPTLVDPKKINFFAYENCTLFKPNLKEIKEGLNQTVATEIKSLVTATSSLSKKLKQKNTLITLAAQGVFYSDGKTAEIIPAHVRNIADVSGAGDTVVAIAALCLAAKQPLKIIASLSNLAGGLVCEHTGVVTIDAAKLLAEAERVV